MLMKMSADRIAIRVLLKVAFDELEKVGALGDQLRKTNLASEFVNKLVDRIGKRAIPKDQPIIEELLVRMSNSLHRSKLRQKGGPPRHGEKQRWFVPVRNAPEASPIGYIQGRGFAPITYLSTRERLPSGIEWGYTQFR